MLTNQMVVNAIYEAADENGQNGWQWLSKGGLTYLAGNRNAPYSGPDIKDIPAFSDQESDAILKRLPMMPTDEETFTNQEVINAFYKAAGERGQDGWAWLEKASLTYLANNREALYDGPDLDAIQGLSNDERALVKSHLGEGQMRFKGDTYTVQFYKGDYRPRQEQAVTDGCIAYVEQHFNAGASNAGYALVIVPDPNPFQVAEDWGGWYANRVAQTFGIVTFGDTGVKQGGFGGRGNGNIKVAGATMPAVLLESLFASNPTHATMIRSSTGQDNLASILVESIKRFFPDGGKIAFSVGHKYKTSNPGDRGVKLHGGGTEAEYAEKVLLKAAQKLQSL